MQYGTVQSYSNPALSKIICIKNNKYVHVKTFFTLISNVNLKNSLGEIPTIFSPSETVNADYVMYKDPIGSVYYYCDNVIITPEGKIKQRISDSMPSGAVLYCEFDYLIS